MQIKTGLVEQMGKFMNAAVELGTPDSAGYARAIRDLVIFIDLAESGSTGAARKKPVPSLEHARRFNG